MVFDSLDPLSNVQLNRYNFFPLLLQSRLSFQSRGSCRTNVKCIIDVSKWAMLVCKL